MPVLTATAIALAGLGVGAAGAATSFIGQQRTITAERDAEHTRQAAMNFDAMRRQRQLIREQQVAQGQAISNASAQGASAGSGLSGGLGQISGEANLGIENNRAAQYFGNREFAANYAKFNAEGITSIGSGLSSLGGALVKNKGDIRDAGVDLYNSIA